MSAPRWPLLAACLLAWTAPLAADIHPNTQSGFAPERVFDSGDIDHVNEFNGSLSLVIPIGRKYPVGGGLEYQIQLVYNSFPWYHYEIVHDTGTTSQAVPSQCHNAGAGWQVTFGSIDRPDCATFNDTGYHPTWTDASGAQHLFFGKLHEADPEDAGDSGANQSTLYSRDGSYARLRYLGGGVKEIDLPSGEILKFDSSGRLTEMRNRILVGGNPANWMRISYATPNEWNLTDSTGRAHKIVFRTDLPSYAQTVDHIELDGFGADRPTYWFRYDTATIMRGCQHTDTSMGATVTVPLLTELDLPDGSFYRAAVSDYETTLNGGLCGFNSGSLLGLQLRTLGKLVWTYQEYRYPQGSSTKHQRASNPGIATRTQLDASGNPVGTWTYTTQPTARGGTLPAQELVNSVTNPLSQRTVRYFTTDLTNVHTGTDWTIFDYSLPFTHNVMTGDGLALSSRTYDTNGTLLRSEYVQYERDQVGGSFTEEQVLSNRRVKRQRTVFEDDGTSVETTFSDFDGLGHYRTQVAGGSFAGGGPRTTRRDTNPLAGTYAVDPATNMTVSNVTIPTKTDAWILGTADYATVEEGNVRAKTEFCYDDTTGLPTRGQLTRQRALRATGTAAVEPVRGAHDLLTAFGYDTYGNPAAEKSYGGDAAAQTLGTGSGPCAVGLPADPEFQINSSWTAGVLASTRYYSTSLHAPASYYSLDRTIDGSGLVASSRDSAGVQTNYTYDSLGRLTSEQPQVPASGNAVDGWTQYTYTAANPTTLDPAQVTVVRRAGNGGSQILARQWLSFDPFGRLYQEEDELPDTTVARRTTTFDAAGNKATVSEWEQNGDDVTRFLDYDPFGRPRKIRPPDEPDPDPATSRPHDVTLVYHGAREILRTMRIAQVAGANETAATTTETYDPQGRLCQVTEPSGSSGALVTTTYGYDEGNRLASVATTAAGVTQTRTFDYDAAGLLLSEVHPEKTTTYQNFTARGKPRRRDEVSHALYFTYDESERVTEIRPPGTPGNCDDPTATCVETFVYGSANSSTNLRNGKLVESTRWHYVPASVLDPAEVKVKIHESRTYGGRQGRVSERVVDVPGRSESFTQGFAYDGMGLPASLDYPRCNIAGQSTCNLGTTAQQRLLTLGHTKGRLTTVTGSAAGGASRSYASSITYYRNRTVADVVHGNGVTDHQQEDAYAMARPRRLWTTGANRNWSSGDFAFDGAGNVKAIGSQQSFLYDPVSRLKSAAIAIPNGLVLPFTDDFEAGTLDAWLNVAVGAPATQSYTYDAFGNLLSMTTSGVGTVVFPTSSRTNRLDSAQDPTIIYDDAGNLTGWHTASYAFDKLDTVWRTTNGAEDWLHFSTAGDERVWSFKLGASPVHRWTLRDLGGTVLREYKLTGGTWSAPGNWGNATVEDYIHRDGQLLASESFTNSNIAASTTTHYHLDHLGSPRLLTDGSGHFVAEHVYYPYGGEATDANQDAKRMRFTGHERDLNATTGANPNEDDLNYMKARYHSPVTGRFLSPDLLLGSARQPQSWNRYTYVRANPLKYIDPQGLYAVSCSADDAKCKADADAFEAARQESLKSTDEAERNSALAYGNPGELNGVTVAFGNTGKANGVTAPDIKGDPSTGTVSLTATVTLKSGLRGTDLRAAAAHEGQHLVDAQTFAKTFEALSTAPWLRYDSSKNLTAYQTETNAFRVTNSVYNAAGRQFSTGCPGCTLGAGVKTRAEVDLAIKRILADPKGAYKLTPASQGNKQLSAWP